MRFASVVSSVLLVCSFAWVCPADEVRREAPPVYAEKMEQELTDLEPLLDQVDYFSPEESDHGTVLEENVGYVAPDGRSYELYQYAYKALSDGNLDYVGMTSFYFRPERETIYLLKAQTILPDGSIREVPPEGILIQTPPKEQETLIFSGRKQMRLIFPQVSVGSVTHCIVLIERDSFRMPEQYADRCSWERVWQTHRKRFVLNLPEEYADRLTMTTIGDGVPEVQTRSLDGGRTRYEWIREKLPIRRSEKLDGPVIQTGPALYLSTLKDWNEFAAWYAGLIRESSVVDDAIRQTAADWAEGATSEDEIIHQLAFRVSKDIRYVSLGFGVGGLQPQPASGVLENRFGDCKDKSNLLRVLLKEHGIKSRVTLINTDHNGFVEKRCVSHGYFNHAILMIEKSDGTVLFCDPTIKYGSVGMLYPSIANREALTIDEEASIGQWVTMPNATAGKLDYAMDLKLSPNGELSGWFTLKADGYYSASLSRRFEATERESLKQDVRQYVDYFYDSPTIIDWELQRAESDRQEFFLKVYFVKDATGQAEQAVSWPEVKWLLPRLGETKDVKREAFLWTDDVQVSVDVELPETLSAASRPEDWSVSAAGFDVSGRWAQNGAVLHAELQAVVANTRVSPVAFPKLFNGVEATRHWLEKSVILKEGTSPDDVSAPEQVASEQLGDEFVMMSTGMGQIDLVDHLYPASTRAAQRTLALKKTKSWFQTDLEVQFNCDVRLGWLAYDREDYSASLRCAQEALQNYGDAVDASDRGWAQYMEALSLEEVGQVEESIQLCAQMAADDELGDYRRGFAAYQAARMMRDTNAVKSVEYYLSALTYDTGNEQWMLKNCYPFLLKQMSVDEFVQFLTELKDVKPEKQQSLMTWLCELGAGNVEYMYGMVDAAKIDQILSACGVTADVVDGVLLEQLRTQAERFENYSAARDELAAHLSDHAYSFWVAEPDKERSFDDYTDDIKAAEGDDVEYSALLALWRMFSLEPEVEFPVWVWDTARRVDFLYKNGADELRPLREQLFSLVRYLPEADTGTIDLWFLKAEVFEREGPAEKALALYQQLHDQQLDEQWHNALYSRWVALLVSSGNLAGTVDVCAKVRPMVGDDSDLLSVVIQGIYALLDDGREEEAVAWMLETAEQCGDFAEDDAAVQHLNDWVEMEQAGTLRSFWEFQDRWQSQWLAAAEAIELPVSNCTFQVEFIDMEAAGQRLGTALNQHDRRTESEVLCQIISGSRWHPNTCFETQSILAYLAGYYEDDARPLRQCAVAMNSGAFQLDADVRYSCFVAELEAYLQLKQYDDLMKKADLYYRDDASTDDQKNLYSRYGALGAVNVGEAGSVWLARMEQELQDPEQRNDPYAVNILCRLYRLENEFSKERDLLQEYLGGEDRDDGEIQGVLASRLEQIREISNQNEQLSLAIHEWEEAFQPAWVSLFPDAQVSEITVEELVRSVDEIMSGEQDVTYEDAAYLLQAARDERLSAAVREDALYEVCAHALGAEWNSQTVLDLLDSIAKDERFSPSLRTRCLYFAANMAFALPVPAYLQNEVFSNAETLGLQEDFDELKGPFELYGALDFSSAQAIADWMDSQREALEPFDQVDIYLFNQCFNNLCSLGRVDLAEQQIERLKKLRFSSTVGNSSFSMQLQWRQQLERLKELMPLHTALQEFFVQRLQPDYVRPDCADLSLYKRSDLAQYRANLGALLQYGLYDHMSIVFWVDLPNVEYRCGNTCIDENNLGALLETILSVCKTDQQYSMVVGLLPELFDTDSEACMKIVEPVVDELLARSELEQTHSVLIFRRYLEEVRRGNFKQVAADLRTETGLSRQNQHYLMLQSMLLAEDSAALNDYLNSANPDLLLADEQLAGTLQAYQKCGRAAEVDLLQEKGMTVLREFMAFAALYGEQWSIYNAIDLAEALGVLGTLDERWVDRVAENARMDHLAYLKMHRCHAQEDWAGTEQFARDLVDCAPSYYDTYFFLGKALIEQEKYEEGAAALKPFVTYCKDSLRYQEALRLDASARAALNGGAPPADAVEVSSL